MIGFSIGLFVGGILGVAIMCFLSDSGHNDYDYDSKENKYKKQTGTDDV